MSEEFFLEYIRLKNQRETFATAMVVQHGTPISGRTGDKAIIRVDGSIHGWIGGGCTHPIVIEEALSLMEAGESRLISIDPESRSAQVVEVKNFQMTCHSGGSLSIYIEPVYPKPQIVVMGDSPVGQSLLQLSSNLGYETIWVSESQSSAGEKSADRIYQGFDMKTSNHRGRSFLIVCTQGEGDQEAQGPEGMGPVDEGAPVHRHQPVEHLDAGRHRDQHGCQHRDEAQSRAHAAGEHVVAVDDEGDDSDAGQGVDHRSVAKYRAPRARGHHLGDDAEGGNHHHVHLGVAEVPEQVAPEQWVATGCDVVEGGADHPVEVNLDEADPEGRD